MEKASECNCALYRGMIRRLLAEHITTHSPSQHGGRTRYSFGFSSPSACSAACSPTFVAIARPAGDESEGCEVTEAGMPVASSEVTVTALPSLLTSAFRSAPALAISLRRLLVGWPSVASGDSDRELSFASAPEVPWAAFSLVEAVTLAELSVEPDAGVDAPCCVESLEAGVSLDGEVLPGESGLVTMSSSWRTWRSRTRAWKGDSNARTKPLRREADRPLRGLPPSL
jgi:hypothetical protein